MSGKLCSGCGEVKQVRDFSRNKTRKDGLKSRCKACDRRYREKRREAIREYNHRYREENHRYREENREAERECQRRYRKANHEAALERSRRYYEENREAILEYHRRRYEENREAERERIRLFNEKMRDMTRESATRAGEPYTPAEDVHILTSDEPAAVIAVELGRTRDSVNARRKRLRKAVSA